MTFNCTRRSLGLALSVLVIASLTSSCSVARADDEPPKLAGTWTWKWKDSNGETHRHTLEVEGEGAKMVARERYDDKAAIKVEKIKIDGKKVTISIDRKDRHSVYVGTIASTDTINGTVTVSTEGSPNSEFGWTATREAGGKKP